MNLIEALAQNQYLMTSQNLSFQEDHQHALQFADYLTRLSYQA